MHADPQSWWRVPPFTTCPTCGASKGCRVLLSPGNLLKGAANLQAGLVVGEPAFPFSLLRKCGNCGTRFRKGAKPG